MEVLNLWPDNRVSLAALAIIYYNKNRYDAALQMLNRILYLDPDNIKLRELKSDILLKIGRIDDSVKEIKILKKSDGYRYFDEFIQSIPVEILSDKYGTIDTKIDSLKNQSDEKTSYPLVCAIYSKAIPILPLIIYSNIKKSLINQFQ